MSALYKPQTNEEFTALLDHLAIEFNLVHGPWISGGTARRLWHNEPWQDHDIDIFFRTEQSFARFTQLIYPYSDLNNQPYITKNATTYSIPFRSVNYKLQCICKKYYSNIFEVWKDFDFTVCCFATDGYTLVADEQALKDIEIRALRIIDGTNRKIDGRRVTKYGIYGFNPTKQVLKELLDQKNQQSITTIWGANDDEY